MSITDYRRSLVTLVLAAASCAAQAAEDKAALVQRVLALWHLEDVAIVMVQRPAADALNQARIALQGRVVAVKQEATLKDIAGDIQKYVDEATPIVRDKAVALKAPTLAPLLAKNFSEDELRQLIALLESPVKKKFESLLPQFERAYGEKVAADSRAAIDPKLQAMTQSVALKLRGATMTP
ncbi:MAG TPA: DUF2059 domain-containing protein [Albitalea sp.]|uniref:DUF2059 domain-containing protein n=1 Tax=Piscinibacter sp. TaxID=1903157 RepID=UPI002ED4F71E